VFNVNEALEFKENIREYVKRNPGTKGVSDLLIRLCVSMVDVGWDGY
jgi:hypothetical protein